MKFFVLDKEDSKMFVYIDLIIYINRDDDEEKPSSFEAELATMDYGDDDFFPDITEEHGEV